MIEVIKRGKFVKYACVCPECDCEFTYQSEDVWFGDEEDGSPEYDFMVLCPDCNHQIDVPNPDKNNTR